MSSASCRYGHRADERSHSRKIGLQSQPAIAAESNEGSEAMKNTTLAGLMAAPLLIFALSLTARAADPVTTTCQDGTTSTSTGKGTCSGHGGVQKAAKTTAAPAAAPAAPATPA